jgi:hypothetical protein
MNRGMVTGRLSGDDRRLDVCPCRAPISRRTPGALVFGLPASRHRNPRQQGDPTASLSGIATRRSGEKGTAPDSACAVS